MSARNSLAAKAERRAARQARKARAEVVRKAAAAVEQEMAAARFKRMHEAHAALERSRQPDYESMKVDELRALAAERDVRGRSKMTKAQLIEALRG